MYFCQTFAYYLIRSSVFSLRSSLFYRYFAPKYYELRLRACTDPPPKKHLLREIQRLLGKDNGLDEATHLPDQQWLLFTLSTLDPNHWYFSKTFEAKMVNDVEKGNEPEYVDNEDGLFDHVILSKKARLAKKNQKCFTDKEQQIQAKIDRNIKRQQRADSQLNVMRQVNEKKRNKQKELQQLRDANNASRMKLVQESYDQQTLRYEKQGGSILQGLKGLKLGSPSKSPRSYGDDDYDMKQQSPKKFRKSSTSGGVSKISGKNIQVHTMAAEEQVPQNQITNDMIGELQS